MASRKEKKYTKKQWTKDEDDLLRKAVNSFGDKNWDDIAKEVPGRNARQCKERYTNNLDPTICKEKWTEEEDKAIIDLVEKIGKRWTQISVTLCGRPANSIKNRWKALERKGKTRVEISENTKSDRMEEEKRIDQGSSLIAPVGQYSDNEGNAHKLFDSGDNDHNLFDNVSNPGSSDDFMTLFDNEFDLSSDHSEF